MDISNPSDEIITIPSKWEAEITSNIVTDNYKTFIEGSEVNTGSYQIILDKFLKDRKNPYGNMPLTKLNICRENTNDYKQLPKIGEYYINATKLEYKK